MLYNINNYFNVQNSGSGIGILTGSFSPSDLLTVNGSINANNIKFDFISGFSGEFFRVTGLNFSDRIPTTIIKPPIPTYITLIKGYLPPLGPNFYQDYPVDILTGELITGKKIEGNIFNFKQNLNAKNFYANLIESNNFTSLKDLEISGNLYIYNPTGKIEIYTKQVSRNFLIYRTNFGLNNNNTLPDTSIEIDGNDSAGKIVFGVSQHQFITNNPIFRVYYTGNYNYNYSPSVIINLINEKWIFSKYQENNPLNNRNFFVLDSDNLGFSVGMSAYPDDNRYDNFQVNFHYLVIS